jgi:hypothetical protein
LPLPLIHQYNGNALRTPDYAGEGRGQSDFERVANQKVLDIPASRKRLGLALLGRHFAAQNDRDRPISATTHRNASPVTWRAKQQWIQENDGR